AMALYRGSGRLFRPRPGRPKRTYNNRMAAPFAKRLVGGNQQGFSFVAGADELKEHAGFGLVFGDVGEVIQDQQVKFVELGNGGFESKLATGNLQSLNEICGAGEQHAPAVFDESEAESCRKVALAPTRRPEQQ